MARTLNDLVRAAGRRALDARPDGELLRRFAESRDADAFEVLVRRHGGMVLGVCARVLGRGGDADDAFQATFLALVRRAASVRAESVGGWLFRVARRASQRAARQRAERGRRECRAARPEAITPDDVERADWRRHLDREVARLPVRFREAFVLCHLEGRPHEDAARELGCPLGTLHSRLARAKERLRARLGVVPVAAGVVVTAAQVRAAVGVAAGSPAAAPVVALSQGVWSPMTILPIKSLAAAVLVSAAIGAGAIAYKPATATATQAAAPRGEPTLDDLKRENERLRREVAELKTRLSKYENRVPVIGDAPTDEDVLRALPKKLDGGAGVVTTCRDDIRIVKNKLVDRLDPPRLYPLVGFARLRHLHWECSVYYTETFQTEFPFPLKVTRPKVQVVYIDKDALILGP